MYADNLYFMSKAYIVLNLCEWCTSLISFVGDTVSVHCIQDASMVSYL